MLIFLLIFPRKEALIFRAIFVRGNKLHELSKSIIWENKKKWFKMSSAESSTKHAKCKEVRQTKGNGKVSPCVIKIAHNQKCP